jgi:hypothetical protein
VESSSSSSDIAITKPHFDFTGPHFDFTGPHFDFTGPHFDFTGPHFGSRERPTDFFQWKWKW